MLLEGSSRSIYFYQLCMKVRGINTLESAFALALQIE